MRILIAGAGIAGLTLAALLCQRGRNVEIVDKAASFSDNNHPLVLTPLGSRVLHGFGILRRFRATSPGLDILRVANGRGEIVGELDIRPLVGADEKCRIADRYALLRLLSELSQDSPIRFKTVIEEIGDEGDKVRVRLSDGSESRYDLVVGADGTDSFVRARMLSEVSRFDTGWGCWEFPTESAESGRALEYWSSGRMLGLYSGPWHMNGIACAPDRKLRGTQDRKVRMQRLFRMPGRNARSAIDAFPDDAAPLTYRKLADCRANTWVKNRICLVGDAACGFLPTSPLGASLAMEEAAVLADEIARAGSNTIPRALEFYEKRCRPRVEAAHDEVRKNAKALFRGNPLLAMSYDASKRFADYRIIGKLMATPV